MWFSLLVVFLCVDESCFLCFFVYVCFLCVMVSMCMLISEDGGLLMSECIVIDEIMRFYNVIIF